MSDTIYHVVALRRGVASQIQLNYRNHENALNAFATLSALEMRKVLTDDFGAKISADPEDIGHVMFMDARRVLEMQGAVSLLQHKAQQELQRAAADPATTIIRPVPAGGNFVG